MTVQLVFHCDNCKLDWHDDAFCEACGRSLMPTLKRAEEKPEPVPDWWADVFTSDKEEKA